MSRSKHADTVRHRHVELAARAASAGSAEVWARDNRLRELGFDGLDEYLRSAIWSAVRKRYRAAGDLPQDCQMCGAAEDVDLHHRTYERIGRERLEDLVPLCATCHAVVHVLHRRGDIPDVAEPEALTDPDRAAANRQTQDELRERQRDEFATSEKATAAALADGRRLLNVLGRRVRHAEKLGVDVTAELSAAIGQVRERIAADRPPKT